MANFLEAIGRSNALSDASKNLLDTAVTMRNMRNQENVAAVNIEMARARNAREQQQHDILMAEAERKKVEYDQQEKTLNAVIPVDSLVGNMGPTAQKRLMNLADQNGWLQDIGGVKVISNRNKMAATQMLQGNLSIQKSLAEDELMDVNNNIQKLTDSLNDPEAKLKDKDKAAVQQQLTVLKQRQVQMLNAINTLDPEIRKITATAESKATTPKEVFGAALQKLSNGEKLSSGEQEVLNVYRKSHNNTDAKDPATVSTMKFLVESGVATDFAEAFSMLGESKTKTKGEAMVDLMTRLDANPLDARTYVEKEAVVQAFGSWYDKQVTPSRRTPQLPLKDRQGKAIPEGTVINGPNNTQYILKGGKWQSK